MIDNFRYYFRRNSVTIAVVVIVVSLLALSLMQAISYNKLSRGAQQRTQQFHQLLEEFKHQSIQMDCIAAFFNQKDRQNKSITDIHKCQITTNSGKTYIYKAVPTSEATNQPTSSPKQSNHSTKQPTNNELPKATNSPASNPVMPPHQTLLQQYVDPVTNFKGGI